MKLLPALALTALVVGAASARADDDVPPSAEETKSIVAALEAMGCKGYDEIEKESRQGGGYHFEIDDANCKDGQFDIKLDRDFKLVSKTRD